ncbi:MAG: hypothetical protein JST58_04660 [Bacteroidetes bacterium]|nr:hypothetical protein [Bacteroidota bacterium]
MKTKFTILIIGCLFIAANTKAQDWGYRHDDRNNGYWGNQYSGNQYGYPNYQQNYYDLSGQLYNLQQRLMQETDELDRARDEGDWDKVNHDRQEIAQIQYQIWQINQRMRCRHEDDDDDN